MNMLAVYTQTFPKYVQAKDGFELLHTMNSIVTVTITTSNRFLVIRLNIFFMLENHSATSLKPSIC